MLSSRGGLQPDEGSAFASHRSPAPTCHPERARRASRRTPIVEEIDDSRLDYFRGPTPTGTAGPSGRRQHRPRIRARLHSLLKNSTTALFQVERAFRLASKSFISASEPASADDRALGARELFRSLFSRADRASLLKSIVIPTERFRRAEGPAVLANLRKVSLEHFPSSPTGKEGVVEIESEWTGSKRERMGIVSRAKLVSRPVSFGNKTYPPPKQTKLGWATRRLQVRLQRRREKPT